jgi:hypothetical protein
VAPGQLGKGGVDAARVCRAKQPLFAAPASKASSSVCAVTYQTIGSKNNYRYLPTAKVLLESDVLVTGYEHLNSCVCGPIKQISVQQPGPAHLIDGMDVMCSQDPPNAYGHILVKQDLGHES